MYVLFRARQLLGSVPALIALVLIALGIQSQTLKVEPVYDESAVELALVEPEPEVEPRRGLQARGRVAELDGPAARLDVDGSPQRTGPPVDDDFLQAEGRRRRRGREPVGVDDDDAAVRREPEPPVGTDRAGRLLPARESPHDDPFRAPRPRDAASPQC